MIHTFKLFFELDYGEVQDLQRRLNIKYTELNQYYDGVYPGVTMSIALGGDGNWRLYIIADAIMLLGKPDIKEADYTIIEQEIKGILIDVVGHASHFKRHVLQRIDYRYDVIIENKDIRMLLMHLYKKTTKLYHYQKRHLGTIKDDKYMPYKTTIYHSSKSVETTAYLKEEERRDKRKRVEYYEKGVVRYEVRLKEDHLYYMDRKKVKHSRPRQLKEYLKENVYKEYLQKYMLPIYHSGDFYKIDEARVKLKQTSLTDLNKRKLIDILKKISSSSLDTPKGKMSSSTQKKRINLLENVGINPILIPKNYPKAPKILNNPLNDCFK